MDFFGFTHRGPCPNSLKLIKTRTHKEKYKIYLPPLLCSDALSANCGGFSPLLTQFINANVFMGAYLCVCVRQQSAVLLKHCLSRQCETTLAYRSILRVPLQQLERARVQESRSVMLVRVPHVLHLHCIQFLCWVLWDSLLVISTFTTKLELVSGLNVFLFCNQLVRVEQQSQDEDISSGFSFCRVLHPVNIV